MDMMDKNNGATDKTRVDSAGAVGTRRSPGKRMKHSQQGRTVRVRVGAALFMIGLLLSATLFSTPYASADTAVPCSTSGTWTQGEVNLYWFDVEQGDSQLIVGPTGKTLLIDLGETSWNTHGSTTKAKSVASKIRSICGTGSSPVALDYVMISHHHLDHIGYAGNPEDTIAYGNGIYEPAHARRPRFYRRHFHRPRCGHMG